MPASARLTEMSEVLSWVSVVLSVIALAGVFRAERRANKLSERMDKVYVREADRVDRFINSSIDRDRGG